MRTHRHTFVFSRETGEDPVILHDNENDPYQRKNIAQEQTETVRRLQQELQAWQEKTGDPWLTVE